MEIIQFIILAKNCYMQKAQTVLTILLLASATFTKIQAQKIPPPPPSPPSENPENSHQPRQVTDFLKHNQTVANIHWKGNNNIIIALKNGKTETYTYDLSKKEVRTDFINKYGLPPTPPPPPATAPPSSPAPPPPPSQKELTD